FGLNPDEGPVLENGSIAEKGDFGPYVQSKRLDIYKEHAKRLVAEEKAYYCFCDAERLDLVRKDQAAQNLPPRYDGHCRSLPPDEVKGQLASGKPFVIRQKVPRTGVTECEDLVYGRLQFKNDLLDDAILMKSDGYPVYNFANVVDDHLMEITHVLRGEEFLPSTPKHVLLYQAFGWTPPLFCHLPLILDAKRQKLSKRSGDVAVEQYVGKGYLKEAILNFVALLGWNPKTSEEIFSLDDLIREFSLEKINKAGAIFDAVKLDYINREWKRKLSLAPLSDPMFALAKSMLESKSGHNIDSDKLEIIWPQINERIKGPSVLEAEIGEFAFYFQDVAYDAALLSWKNAEKSVTASKLRLIRDFLTTLDIKSFSPPDLEAKIKEYLQERGVGFGEALWPLRVALSGQKNSPSPFEIISAMEKIEPGSFFKKIEKAIDLLGLNG
ncbi:MAG: glutamate--tRNA ligase, partial [bacterium]|nr:glutamate--tRNA ligase [bacterium]